MSCSCSNSDSKNTLSIIQGDTFDLNLTFGGTAASEITGVTFSSRALGLEKELQEADDSTKWGMHLGSSETLNLNAGTFDYDITVTFTGNAVRTVAYRQGIQILKKINVTIGEE